MRRFVVSLLVVGLVSGLSVPSAAHAAKDSQTLCPVMGNPIDRSLHADADGVRVYFCCAGCPAKFRKNPGKYIAAMRADGVEPERLGKPQTLCPVMKNPIDRSLYEDFDGERVYFCCAGCVDKFLKDPGRIVKKMKAQGIELAAIPATDPDPSAADGADPRNGPAVEFAPPAVDDNPPAHVFSTGGSGGSCH